MKKKIAILGSTGSIGKSLLKIISKDKKKYEIVLLTAKKNYKLLLHQAHKFNVRNIIIADSKNFELALKFKKKRNLNIFNNFEYFHKIFNNKIDYTMSSIVGLDGLYPTFKIIKYTKKIAIANKETIICGWNFILKELKKNKTEFIPVDSEHFSIWHALNSKLKSNHVKKIYLTASGGPLLNISKNKFNSLKMSQILKHPNWSMGKKITVDSSTLMNKVFEIIEAKKIFNIKYNQLKVLIHPDSYVHAIIEFKNKMISIVAHNTTMDIPIYNSLTKNNNVNIKKNLSQIDLKKLNNLCLENVNLRKFSSVKILNKLPDKDSLFETVIVSANDELVNLYLKKKIKYTDIIKILFKVLKLKEMRELKYKKPKKIVDIISLSKYVRSKVIKMSV